MRLILLSINRRYDYAIYGEKKKIVNNPLKGNN